MPATVPFSAGAAAPRPPGADELLDRLSVLLDSDLVATRLATMLVPGTVLHGVRVRRVDVQPCGTCRVAYAVETAAGTLTAVAESDRHGRTITAAHAPAAVTAAMELGRDGAVARPLGYDARLAALVHWYPLDPALPVLARPARVVRRLAGLASEGETPRLLVYRPGQRAVLRADGVVLKAYGDGPGYTAAVRALELVARRLPLAVATPRLLRRVDEHRLTVQRAHDGAELEHASAAAVGARAGAILRAVHATPVPDALPSVGSQDALATALRSARLVAAVAPALAGPADDLVARLRAEQPACRACVTSHGDFNVSQLLDTADGLVLLDLDETCAAPPAFDVAAYAANVISGRPGDLERSRRALDALLTGYGERPEGLGWYLAAATLARAASPFRRFKRDWPQRMAAVLAAAQAVTA